MKTTSFTNLIIKSNIDSDLYANRTSALRHRILDGLQVVVLTSKWSLSSISAKNATLSYMKNMSQKNTRNGHKKFAENGKLHK